MAVADWSTNPTQNVELGGYKLNGEFGAIFAELMAQLKAKLDSVDDGAEAMQSAIGAWTDTSETTTVKAAIEALRPEPETEG